MMYSEVVQHLNLTNRMVVFLCLSVHGLTNVCIVKVLEKLTILHSQAMLSMKDPLLCKFT